MDVRSMSYELDKCDWLSSEFNQDPYPLFTWLRDNKPLAWSDDLGGHIVTRYDDVKAILSDSTTFAQSEFFEAAFSDMFQRATLVNLNPPDHDDVRNPVSEYFRPSAFQQRMGEVVQKIVDELVSDVIEQRRFEMREDLSTRLTMRVMSSLMGTDDTDAMRGLYKACMTYVRDSRTNIDNPDVRERGQLAGQRLMDYLGMLLESRQRDPGGDLLSAFTTKDIDREVVLAVCGVVLLAGVETTIGGLGNTMLALMAQPPRSLDSLRDGQFSGVHAFEEGLRWMAPLSLKARQVAKPTTMHGIDLREGESIFVSLGSANRDPRHYLDPDEFQLGRRNRDHLAFGSGAHYCIGAPLARIEAGTLFDALLNRCPNLHLSPDQHIEFAGGPVYRSPRELWLEI